MYYIRFLVKSDSVNNLTVKYTNYNNSTPILNVKSNYNKSINMYIMKFCVQFTHTMVQDVYIEYELHNEICLKKICITNKNFRDKYVLIL
jgi:hypothetical protein